MNLCNKPDHGAINAERAESRGLRKAWVDLDDKRQILERELATVTEQRDELAESLDFQFKLNRECIDQITTRMKERDEAREQRDRLLEEREQWRLSSVCRKLVEQRDKLAEALQNVINEDGTPISIDRADETLQSLNLEP